MVHDYIPTVLTNEMLPNISSVEMQRAEQTENVRSKENLITDISNCYLLQVGCYDCHCYTHVVRNK